MESEYEKQVDISQTADGFMVLSRIEAVKVQVEESQAEVERMCQDPDTSKRDIEVLQDCLRVNLELLDLIEKADQDFYNEVSKLSD